MGPLQWLSGNHWGKFPRFSIGASPMTNFLNGLMEYLHWHYFSLEYLHWGGFPGQGALIEQHYNFSIFGFSIVIDCQSNQSNQFKSRLGLIGFRQWEGLNFIGENFFPHFPVWKGCQVHTEVLFIHNFVHPKNISLHTKFRCGFFHRRKCTPDFILEIFKI